MCAQQTAADMPSAGLNITELADQYTRPVRGIGHQYRLTREDRKTRHNPPGSRCVKRRSDPRPTMYPGWLATTMRRFSAAAIRRRHRESPASDWIDTFAPKDLAPELADAVAMEHATARLHQAITQLPERERCLIQLQFGPANHGYTQIIRSMHMPIGSIGPIRGRALRRLRTLLHDLE